MIISIQINGKTPTFHRTIVSWAKRTYGSPSGQTPLESFVRGITPMFIVIVSCVILQSLLV